MTEPVVDRLREGIEQRRAALAALDDLEQQGRLLDLEQAQNIGGPKPVARPVIGPVLTLLRKLGHILFVRGYAREQAGFNRAAAQRIGELVRENSRLRGRVDALSQRVESLERSDEPG